MSRNIQFEDDDPREWGLEPVDVRVKRTLKGFFPSDEREYRNYSWRSPKIKEKGLTEEDIRGFKSS